MVLGLAECPYPALDGLADPVVVDRIIVEVGELVGDLDLPIRRGGIHEDDLNVKVKQMGDRGKDFRGDLTQRIQQEIHRRIGGVLGEARAAFDGDPLGDPAGGSQLGAGFQRTLRHQREDHPLGCLPIQAATVGDPAQRGTDAQPFPQPVQRPRPTQPPGVEHLHLAGPGRGHRLFRVQEPGDRGHQPGQRVPIDGVGAPEVVDHLRRRHPGDWVAFAVRQLQIGNHAPVAVAPLRLPQVHPYRQAHNCCSCPATRP